VNRLRGCLAFTAAAVLWSGPAAAKDLYFNCSTQISNGAVTTVYSSGIFLAPTAMYATRDYSEAFKQFLMGQGLRASYASCSTSQNVAKAFEFLDYSENFALKMKGRFKVVNWAPAGGQTVRRGDRDMSKSVARVDKTKSAPSQSRDQAETAPASGSGKTRAEYEAEYQTKLAAHEAKVAEYQRKLKAREQEIARQNAEHAAAQEEARKAQLAYRQKMTMFERVVEEQKRRQREYEAALARNNRCRDGDSRACAEIKAGKPALEEKLADAGEAKTSDDDARACVTEPVVSASTAFRGQTQAVVFNGCKTAVDVRICLLRTGGWNCGVTWGLKPQERWTHTTFQSQGGIFWDARMSGTNRPLASPEGIGG